MFNTFSLAIIHDLCMNELTNRCCSRIQAINILVKLTESRQKLMKNSLTSLHFYIHFHNCSQIFFMVPVGVWMAKKDKQTKVNMCHMLKRKPESTFLWGLEKGE